MLECQSELVKKPAGVPGAAPQSEIRTKKSCPIYEGKGMYTSLI